MKTDRIAQVKAFSVLEVAKAFDFVVSGRTISPCPVCRAAKRHTKQNDRRGAVGPTVDGGGWRCHQCETGGSSFDFAAWAVLGRAPRRGDMSTVLEQCAGRGLCDDSSGHAAQGVVRRQPVARQEVEDAPKRPPADELSALWAASYPLADVPSDLEPAWTGDTRMYLVQRSYDVGIGASEDLARVLPQKRAFRYPGWWPHDPQTYRIVMPLFDETGHMASVQARAIVENVTPTKQNVRGYEMGGLVFACRFGQQFLAGTHRPEQVIIVEGLTDMFKTVGVVRMRPDLFGRGCAVLGYISGSHRLFERFNWPPGVPCIIAVDNGEQGESYAEKLEAALPDHVVCVRALWQATGGLQAAGESP